MLDKKPLLWEPETLERLRARVPAALEKLWDYSALTEGETPTDRPGLDRTHVLDVAMIVPSGEFGIRTILSREKIGMQAGGPPGVFVHGSCSCRALPEGTMLRLDPQNALRHIISLVRPGVVKLHHLFAHGPVVHVIIEMQEVNP